MDIDLSNSKSNEGIELNDSVGADLGEMFKDASLNNLTWLRDGITLEPNSKDLDTKDDLEVQWDHSEGDIGSMEYQDSPEAEKMPTPCDSTLDIDQKVREYLNKGMAKDDIFVVLGKKYSPKEVKLAKKQWEANKTENLYGIVGRIAVDVRGYSNPKDALKHASASPYKRFIKYVIGAKGDKENRFKNSEIFTNKVASSEGDSSSDFFNDETQKVTLSTEVYSKNLNMPVLAHSFDLDPSFADETVMELSSMNYMSKDELDTLKKEAKSSYSLLKKAFNLIDKKKAAKKASSYKEKVSNSEYVIKKADTIISIANKPKSRISINDVALPKADKVIIPNPDSLGKVVIDGKEMDVDLNKKASNNLKFKIKKADIELDVENSILPPIDIEPDTYKEVEFEGADSFDLNDEKNGLGELDIDGSADFSF